MAKYQAPSFPTDAEKETTTISWKGKRMELKAKASSLQSLVNAWHMDHWLIQSDGHPESLASKGTLQKMLRTHCRNPDTPKKLKNLEKDKSDGQVQPGLPRTSLFIFLQLSHMAPVQFHWELQLWHCKVKGTLLGCWGRIRTHSDTLCQGAPCLPHS